jgi:hypothetical protein
MLPVTMISSLALFNLPAVRSIATGKAAAMWTIAAKFPIGGHKAVTLNVDAA